MTAPTNPTELLINLLKDPTSGIKVYEDDGVTQIPVLVSGEWYDKKIFESYGVQVTVGRGSPTIAEIMDLGAYHKVFSVPVPVNVWILRKRGVNYTPERVMWDVLHEINRVVWINIHWPASDIRDIDLSEWTPRDEPENKILRSEATVTATFEMETSGPVETAGPGTYPQRDQYDFSCSPIVNVKKLLGVWNAGCFNTLNEALDKVRGFVTL